MSGSGSVIMIYGLTPGRTNCDHVFNLLCSYGNVLKVLSSSCRINLNTFGGMFVMEFWRTFLEGNFGGKRI